MSYPTNAILSLTALLASAVFSLAEDAPIPLGKLERFWRNSPAISPFTAGGYSLHEIPDYLKSGDFPYPFRPYPKEVPFADHLTMVRILGGHLATDSYDDVPGYDPADGDLAFRTFNGKIGFRGELLEARLAPYLENGYEDLTIVLDNVPWCFPSKPVNGPLGQSAPPADLGEWKEFIETFCKNLIRIAGPERAGRIRFRLGTEMNGTERFAGSQEEFLAFFDASVAGVRAALPEAPFSIFNVSGASVKHMAAKNVNPYAVAEHVFAPGRFADPKPFAWMALSRYYGVWTDPEDNARGAIGVWDEFDRLFPAAGGISREIHEFGIAPFGEAEEGRFPSAEPGALGAAVTSQMLWLLHGGGIDRGFHWTLGDRFRSRDGDLHQLFIGDAWVLQVLEAMAGGQTWRFPLLDPPLPVSSVLAHGSLQEEAGFIMVSAFHRHGEGEAPQTVRFRLPPEWDALKGREVQFVRFNRENAPHDFARRLLEEADALAEDFKQRPGRLGGFREMARDKEAEWFLADRLLDFETMWVESLVLRPLDPSVGKVEFQEGGAMVTATLGSPEILVLKIR